MVSYVSLPSDFLVGLFSWREKPGPMGPLFWFPPGQPLVPGWKNWEKVQILSVVSCYLWNFLLGLLGWRKKTGTREPPVPVPTGTATSSLAMPLIHALS